jgi:small subunit ribosomal protein S17e
MGRIKTQFVKRTTEQLLSKYKDQFTNDFAANKALVNQFLIWHSTKLRNNVAGYVTRLVRIRKAKNI